MSRREKNGNGFIIFIILLIVIGVLIGIFMPNKPNTNTVNNNNVSYKNNNSINQNKITNTQENKQTENNEVQNTENIESQNQTETFTQMPKTEEEKAIEIVKKDYGTSANIEFSVVGMDGNNQIVCVTDSRTSQTLMFYKVNVQKGTFEKQY